jgi:hypothetical protein
MKQSGEPHGTRPLATPPAFPGSGGASADSTVDLWPALPYDSWRETYATVHRWLQILGKVRVAAAPWVNHQWHVTLHLTSRGLTTRPIPTDGGTFQLDVDVFDHLLKITRSDGREGSVALEPRTVADFHHALFRELDRMDVRVRIHPYPNEVPDPVPFAEDEQHGAYDGEAVHRFWRAVSSSAEVFEEFRAGFVGKCSPVHFFWGAMDLAVSRFSGRRAPEHPGGVPGLPDRVTREAYSHEVSSAGFWAGGDAYPLPIFYSYAYPSPAGFPGAAVAPHTARWDAELAEFVLPYDAVRTAASPRAEILAFLESTYAAAATLGEWDRSRLEWGPDEQPAIGGWRQPR